MRATHPIPPPANDHPASPPSAPPSVAPQSGWCKLIVGGTILGLLTVIFLAASAGTPPELGLNPGCSLWSLNISTSHSKLVTVNYPTMKLLFSFDNQLEISRPSLASTFPGGPGCMTSLRAQAQSTLEIVTDLGVNSLVRTLNGGEVTVDMVAKAKGRLRLGPWWVAVFDLDISCMGLTFTAPTDGEGGGGDWMILGGTLSCSLNITPRPW